MLLKVVAVVTFSVLASLYQEDICSLMTDLIPSTLKNNLNRFYSKCSIPICSGRGELRCSHKDNITCDLICPPGYVSANRSRTSCEMSNQWTVNPELLECVPSVGLIVGGWRGNSNKVEVFSSYYGCELPELPDRRYYHTVDYVDGNVILCGGYEGKSQTSCLYLDMDNKWRELVSLNSPFSGGNSVVVNSMLYLVGGSKSPRTSIKLKMNQVEGNQLEVNITDWVSLSEDTMSSCSVAISPTSFVVTGGSTSHRKTILYDTENGSVEYLADMNSKRFNHGCAVYTDDGIGYIIVGGGFDGSAKLSSSEIYNSSSNEWEIVGEMSTRRQGTRLMVIEGDQVIAVGGMALDNLGSVEMFDPKTKKWTLKSNGLIYPRSLHAVTAVPLRRFNCKK